MERQAKCPVCQRVLDVVRMPAVPSSVGPIGPEWAAFPRHTSIARQVCPRSGREVKPEQLISR
jgi:hypothetical protein